jgi:hypothetical protein
LTKDGAGPSARTTAAHRRAAAAQPMSLEAEVTMDLIRRGARSAGRAGPAEIAAMVDYPVDRAEATTKRVASPFVPYAP